MSSFVISQILVSIAFVTDIAAFQFRKRDHLLICFVISCVLLGVHFLLLGNHSAGGLVLLSAVRFFTFIFTNSRKVLGLFLVSNVAIVVGTYSGFLSILGFVASTNQMLAAFSKNDKKLRIMMMVGTSIWIVHNIISRTPAAVALETFFLLSNFVGYYRYYIRNVPKELNPELTSLPTRMGDFLVDDSK